MDNTIFMQGKIEEVLATTNREIILNYANGKSVVISRTEDVISMDTKIKLIPTKSAQSLLTEKVAKLHNINILKASLQSGFSSQVLDSNPLDWRIDGVTIDKSRVIVDGVILEVVLPFIGDTDIDIRGRAVNATIE